MKQLGRATRHSGYGVPAALSLLLFAACPGLAATPAPAVAASPAEVVAPTTNETLVARIALYPDDLIAIILPASTFPLQVVEAARYLDKRTKDPKLPIKDSWDASVKSLLNYPTVIQAMNADLDWMQALGDAVVADQENVLAAVQSYRRKVYAAGNLKSDAKQVVAMDQDIITIAPADPQVIYVPQYNPTTIMVYGGYSTWGYYGYGYPSYYYPYAPGAALAAGLIWGAAIGAAWNGGHYVTHYGGYGGYGGGGIHINNGDINIGSGNRPGGGTGAANRPGAGGGTAWKPSAQPRASTGRVGDPARGGGMGPSASTGAIGASAGNRGASAGQYGPSASASAGGSRGGAYGPPSTAASNRGGSAGAGASAGQYGSSRGSYGGGYSKGAGASSFGGYGSGHSTSMASSRGSMSRGYSGGGRRR